MDGGTAQEWCAQEFLDVDLGDARLNKRLVGIAAGLLEKPETSLTRSVGSASAVRAMGRFFDNHHFDHNDIMTPHFEQTLARLEGHQTVLAIHDTTHLNFSSHRGTTGLGHVGTAHSVDCQGIMMHSSLAISTGGECFGLLFEKLWTRPKHPKKTKLNAHQTVPFSAKESFKWVEAVRSVDGLLGGLRKRPEIVWVSDRESDIYEYLAEVAALGQQFLVRANCNRVVDSPERYVWETLLSAPVAGYRSLDVHELDGTVRRTKLEIRFCALPLRAQRRKGGANVEKLPDIEITGLLVREAEPPENGEPIEWCLLTNVKIDTLDKALEVIGWYEKRWHIECFHKALKSGMKAEDCRLDDVAKLKKFISLASILATRLYWAAHLSRQHPSSPCTAILNEIEWKVLYLKAKGQPPNSNHVPTLAEATTWIAQLGGFRNTYKQPGMIVFWRGWQNLLALVEGFQLARTLVNGGRD